MRIEDNSLSNKKSEKIKREVNVMEQFEDGNAVPLIEVINFNYKKLTNRIDTIRRILKLLSASIDCKSETKSLLIIKEQYEKMYIAIVRSGEYQKYSKPKMRRSLPLLQESNQGPRS